MGAIQYSYDGAGQGVQKTVGTQYVISDALGSTRLLLNATGGVAERFDYLPFGEELEAGLSGRTSDYSSLAYPALPDQQDLKFTGKERDAESGLDFFNARYMSSAQGRFTSTDPFTASPLHIINPQRWNMYSYAMNNPLFYIDPDGLDAIAVNFSREVGIGPIQAGHEGLISVHADGSAQYARFGPAGGNMDYGPGQVMTQDLGPVAFGPDELPTDASYKSLAQQVATIEGQDPSTVRMNYFKTSGADTIVLDAWIKRMKGASDQRKAPHYSAYNQNCTTFCIAGLIQANAIQNRNISIIPNTLFNLLSGFAAENYSQGQRTIVTSKICFTDENGIQVCQ